MLGGKNKQPLGYTIVEVMVVLAVSGVMFLIAASFINGKQGQALFTSGVTGMNSELQNIIEQVSDGRYSDVILNCSGGGGGGALTFSGNGNQGTNQDCVFRGKLIHFYGNPMQSYELISMADSRTDTTPENSFIANQVTGIPNLTSQASVPQHLTVAGFKTDGTNNINYNIAILQSAGSVSGGSMQSGGQSLELAYSTNLNTTSALNNETSITGGPTMQIIKSAEICLTDGQHYATVDIGATNGNPMSVNTQAGLNACP